MEKILVEGALLEKIDKQDFSDLLCSLGLKQRSHGSQHMEQLLQRPWRGYLLVSLKSVGLGGQKQEL